MNRGIGVGQGSAVVWQHFYGGAHLSEQEIVKHFEENARHLAFRRNGNVLYHEIISFSAGHYLRHAELTNIVADIGQEYLRLRAPEQLAYGVVHFDTEHIHLHLMISANSVGRSERVRLSKKAFADIQMQLENFVLERYPDMAQTPVYRGKEQREQCKHTADEQAMVLRTNLPSRKELLTDRLQRLFLQAEHARDFERRCQSEGLRFYQRGKTLGVVVQDVDGTERKHRLSTLGVLKAYESMQARFLDLSRNASV